MSTVLCSAHITICDILRNPIHTHHCRISTGSCPDAMLVWGHAAEEILVPVCVAMGSYENPDRLTRLTKLFAKKSAGCFDGAQNCHFDCIDTKIQLCSHRTTNAVRDHPGLALGKPGSRLIQFLIDEHFLCTSSMSKTMDGTALPFARYIMVTKFAMWTPSIPITTNSKWVVDSAHTGTK